MAEPSDGLSIAGRRGLKTSDCHEDRFRPEAVVRCRGQPHSLGQKN
jgi:hypothetical protein